MRKKYLKVKKEEDYEGIGNVIIGFADGKAPEAAPRLDHRVIIIE